MSKDDFRIFIAFCIGAVLFVFLICFIIFFLAIEIPRMRNESPTQQLYNRCLAATSYDTAGKNCQYVLQEKK